jgi:hypothetical protein
MKAALLSQLPELRRLVGNFSWADIETESEVLPSGGLSFMWKAPLFPGTGGKRD